VESADEALDILGDKTLANAVVASIKAEVVY